MIQNLYGLYDKVAKSLIGGVHLLPHDAVAVRAMRDTMSNPQTDLARHPDDFELLCLGAVDMETGEIRVPEFREVVMSGSLLSAMGSEVTVS